MLTTLAGREPSASAMDPAPASVSADGRFTAFTSPSRLTPDDTNDEIDLYIFDVLAGRTMLESVPNAGPHRFRPILYPRLSGDGRFVVFQAVIVDGPPWWQTVLLDRRDRTTRIVSLGPTGELANGHCTVAVISADGSTVVFESLATNLLETVDVNGRVADIFASTTRRPHRDAGQRRQQRRPAARRSQRDAVGQQRRTVCGFHVDRGPDVRPAVHLPI